MLLVRSTHAADRKSRIKHQDNRIRSLTIALAYLGNDRYHRVVWVQIPIRGLITNIQEWPGALKVQECPLSRGSATETII